jgi:hypothetical protein
MNKLIPRYWTLFVSERAEEYKGIQDRSDDMLIFEIEPIDKVTGRCGDFSIE